VVYSEFALVGAGFGEAQFVVYATAPPVFFILFVPDVECKQVFVVGVMIGATKAATAFNVLCLADNGLTVIEPDASGIIFLIAG
jgi:hypothetical protein